MSTNMSIRLNDNNKKNSNNSVYAKGPNKTNNS